MHSFTREFLEYLSDRLQVGKLAPNYELEVYKKLGVENNEIGINGRFSTEPLKFDGSVISMDIDRRFTMSADESSISIENNQGRYSPDYSTKKKFTNIKGLSNSGYSQGLLPYNLVKLYLGYGDERIQVFTGQITDVDISEKFPTISITAKNELRKLLKPIDPVYSRQLVYTEKSALEIVVELCKEAGVEKVSMDVDEVSDYDYAIEKAVFEIGTTYKDAIDKLLESMGHRIYADRFGAIRVEKLEEYSQKSMEHWIFDDYIDLTQGSYHIDSSLIRNRIIVQSKNAWKAYEDPVLLKMANNERISSGVEVPWAETDEQKKMVANSYFMGMRRKMRRLTVAVVGNAAMDTGDLVRLKMLSSTANDKYMITGIKSNYSSSGYIDVVDLELVAETENIAVEAPGKYEVTEEEEGTIVTYNMRDKIVEEARRWIGTYYQWGGDKLNNKNHYGFDCSHFTYVVYKKFGLMDSYKTASNQKRWANPITNRGIQKGDLVFYTNKSGNVNHVGIYIGDEKVISASGGDSSTNTIGKARQKNAKIKVHSLNYRKGPIYFGNSPKM